MQRRAPGADARQGAPSFPLRRLCITRVPGFRNFRPELRRAEAVAPCEKRVCESFTVTWAAATRPSTSVKARLSAGRSSILLSAISTRRTRFSLRLITFAGTPCRTSPADGAAGSYRRTMTPPRRADAGSQHAPSATNQVSKNTVVSAATSSFTDQRFTDQRKTDDLTQHVKSRLDQRRGTRKVSLRRTIARRRPESRTPVRRPEAITRPDLCRTARLAPRRRAVHGVW